MGLICLLSQVPLYSTQPAQPYAVVLLAIIYHGFSDHGFQTGSHDTWFDSELSKASCHNAEDHLSGSLKHWQHTKKRLFKMIFKNNSFKIVPLKYQRNDWLLRAVHVPFNRWTRNDKLKMLRPLGLLTVDKAL